VNCKKKEDGHWYLVHWFHCNICDHVAIQWDI
jgi:hypothetical protein